MNLSNYFFKIYNGTRSKITMFDNLMYKRTGKETYANKYSCSHSEDYFLSYLEENCSKLKTLLKEQSILIKDFNYRENCKLQEMLEQAFDKTKEVDEYIVNKKRDKLTILLEQSRKEIKNTIDACKSFEEIIKPKPKPKAPVREIIITKQVKKTIDSIQKAIDENSYINITYKGSERVIYPIDFVGGGKVEALHISGYTKSNSDYPRNFFVDEIKVLDFITIETRLQNIIDKADKKLTVSSENINPKFKVIYLSDNNGEVKYAICPADYSDAYALFSMKYYPVSELKEHYAKKDYVAHPQETCAEENPNAEYDYDNDGGSSRYRFYSMRDVVMAIHQCEIYDLI
jgi:hypothetical protein